jgi:hypothetical protein
MDCGRHTAVTYDAQFQRSIDCAKDASSKHQTFWTMKEQAGADKWTQRGLFGMSDGTMMTFDRNIWRCPGPDCRDSLTIHYCLEPRSSVESSQLWIECRDDRQDSPDHFVALFTGSDRKDCGHYGLQPTEADMRASLQCAKSTADARRPAVAMRRVRGIDSAISNGILSTSTGALMALYYASSVSGGAPPAQFTVVFCVPDVVPSTHGWDFGCVQSPAEATASLRGRLMQGPKIPLKETELAPTPPAEGWAMGMTSWVASDKSGLIYILQRGDKADPIVVMDPATGKVVRSWGKGLYTMPHAIRIDPGGNVWTTDAASSMVYKFKPDGTKLMEISVGGQPSPCRNNFCGTTDIAFAPDGHLLIADGYANARILEYTADGKKVREWGTAGTGPGQFRLPHSIQIDDAGVIYVADRENARVQRFDREGRYLGEWAQYGKTFGLKLDRDALWLATQPRNEPNLSPGWLVKIDRLTGELLGSVEVTGVHGMDVMPNGNLLVGPGPGAASPRWFRLP